MQENDTLAVDMPSTVLEATTGTPDAEEVKLERPVDEVIKDRLGRQQHKHNKELRSLHSKIADLESKFSQPMGYNNMQNPPVDYSGPVEDGSMQDIIHKSVAAALQAEQQKKMALEQHQKMQHVQNKYQALHEDLDKAAMEHEDFDDVVRGNNVKFTEAMRDTAVLLPRDVRAQVLYKLGKNPSELERISNLHPVDQAEEMVKLALAMGSESKTHAPESRPLGQVKNSPISTQAINEKTSVSELRKRLKDGWGKRR